MYSFRSSKVALLGLCLLALVSSLPSTFAKKVTGEFQLEAGDFYSGPEYEVTKYTFVVGKGLVRGKFVYRNPHTWMTSPALYLFMDEKWEDYHFAPSCEDKIKHSHASVPIGKLTRSHTDVLHTGVGKATKSEVKEIDNGMVEFSFTWEIDTTVRSRGWFLLVADCALEQFNTVVPPMTYEIELYNPGLTHLPADEYGLPKLYLFVWVGMGIYMAVCATWIYKEYKESNKIHLVIYLLMTAVLLQWFSFLSELIHLWYYKYNGVGTYAADLMSEVFEGLSQTLISFVLICLASGWTLVESDSMKSKGNSVATLLRNPQRLVQGANVVIVLILTLVCGSMFLQVLNKSHDDDFSKFHDYESTPGKLLVLIRFLLGVAFVLSLHFTIKSQSLRGGGQVVSFMRRLMLVGGAWFLSFPLLVGAASAFPHYLRHRVVTGGVMLLQTSLLSFLSYEFLSHSSTYYKVSSLADAGVLPGAGGLMRAPKQSKD